MEVRKHRAAPWKAVLAQGAEILEGPDPLGGLDPGAEVDISIRRASALPDADGFLPGSYATGDAIDLWQDIYVEDGDPSTDADARWAQAQAMADGLNAAWRTAEPDAPGQPDTDNTQAVGDV